MTAQIGDTFKFSDENYEIVSVSESIEFNPQEYGITPEQVCTACWKGYWCVYNITPDGILLEDLYINSKDGYYPEINGVKPVSEYGEGKELMYFGHRLYKKINIKIPYTGKILAGDEFLDKYYIHMGLQRPLSYKKLVSFVFKDGKLIATNDQSDLAATLRAKYDEVMKDENDPNREVLIFNDGDEEYYLCKMCGIDVLDVWWV